MRMWTEQWNDATWHRVVFDGVLDFCESRPSEANKHRDVDHYGDIYRTHRDPFTGKQSNRFVMTLREWYGCADHYQVQKYVRDGWPEGLERLRNTLGSVKLPPLPSLRRTKSRGDMGDEVDMQRIWSGDLSQAWSRMESRDTMGRPVNATLVVNIGGNYHQTAERMFWTGATAAALCEAFRKSGRSCKILAVMPTEGLVADPWRNTLIEVPVQEYGRAVAMETIASMLCLTGTFRHYGFRSMLAVPEPVTRHLGLATDVYPQPWGIHKSWAIDIGKVWDRDSAEKVLKDFMEGKER